MRVMPTVKFGDRFGIAFSGFGLDQHTLLEMCLELALQRDEKRGAIVTVPIGEAAWYDLGVVDLNLHLRVARQRGMPRFEQQVAVESKSGRHHPIQLEFQFLVVVGCVHGCPRFARLNLAHSEYDLGPFVEMLGQCRFESLAAATSIQLLVRFTPKSCRESRRPARPLCSQGFLSIHCLRPSRSADERRLERRSIPRLRENRVVFRVEMTPTRHRPRKTAPCLPYWVSISDKDL